MITDEEMVAMRETVELAFPDTLTRLTASYAETAEAGRVLSWVEGASTPCRFVSGGVLNNSAGISAGHATVAFPFGFELSAQDRVRVLGVDYSVIRIQEASAWAVRRTAQLVRVEADQ